jgi:uncharacterized OsmC-like protein
MLITAVVRNAGASHEVSVSTAGASQTLMVPAKSGGQGSAVNGGEFLMLALATCYCNDLYREASRLGINLSSVEVFASAEFNGRGLAAENVRYTAKVESESTEEELRRLVAGTDAVAEVHNTLRSGVPVSLQRC